jgi:IQ calmodulin-binding motif
VRFLRMRAAATTIAAYRRGQLQRRKFKVELAENRAAVVTQSAARRWLARHEAKRRRAAIITIQCGLRKKQLRQRCAAREADMRQQVEFAQNRALRAKEKAINMERELAVWHKIQEDFQMGPEQVRESLMAWRASESTPASSVAAAPDAGAALTEHDSKELRLFQVHREAFFAWQMGGLDGGASEEEEQELQVRCHFSCAQMFSVQQVLHA